LSDLRDAETGQRGSVLNGLIPQRLLLP
jgi:hypothetical protein